MKAWFKSMAALGVVFTLALIFSGQVMLASEKLVYIPKTMDHQDSTVAVSRTTFPMLLRSNYFADGLVYRPDIADHRVSSIVDFRTASAEKRSTRLVVDGSYYIPNIQGP